jgi:hypothetical protein
MTNSSWGDHSVSFLRSDQMLTVIVDGQYYTISRENPNFETATQALRDKDVEALEVSIKPILAVEKVVQSFGFVRLENDTVYYGDEVLHGVLVDRILEYARDGIDTTGLVMFLDNLMKNPSRSVVQEFYEWLEAAETPCPITEDGHFLAYKAVRKDFKDIYSNTLDYSVGNIVEMPRNQVDDKRENTCSAGLHFCSLSYLPHYAYGNYPVIIVKINPADVVSFPQDCATSKGRTCKMEVIGLHKKAHTEAAWDKGYTTTAENDDRVVVSEEADEGTTELKYFSSRDAARAYARGTGYKFRDVGYSSLNYRWAVEVPVQNNEIYDYDASDLVWYPTRQEAYNDIHQFGGILVDANKVSINWDLTPTYTRWAIYN